MTIGSRIPSVTTTDAGPSRAAAVQPAPCRRAAAAGAAVMGPARRGGGGGRPGPVASHGPPRRRRRPGAPAGPGGRGPGPAPPCRLPPGCPGSALEHLVPPLLQRGVVLGQVRIVQVLEALLLLGGEGDALL